MTGKEREMCKSNEINSSNYIKKIDAPELQIPAKLLS